MDMRGEIVSGFQRFPFRIPEGSTNSSVIRMLAQLPLDGVIDFSKAFTENSTLNHKILAGGEIVYSPDFATIQLVEEERTAQLTRVENILFDTLTTSPNTAFSDAHLLMATFIVSKGSLSTHMSNTRSKLGPNHGYRIKRVRKPGYLFDNSL